VAALPVAALTAAVRYPFATDPSPFAADVVPLSVHGHAVGIITCIATVTGIFPVVSRASRAARVDAPYESWNHRSTWYETRNGVKT